MGEQVVGIDAGGVAVNGTDGVSRIDAADCHLGRRSASIPAGGIVGGCLWSGGGPCWSGRRPRRPFTAWAS